MPCVRQKVGSGMKVVCVKIDGEEYGVGYDTIPGRKKPSLIITNGNCATVCASFRSKFSAELFMNQLKEMFGIHDEQT